MLKALKLWWDRIFGSPEPTTIVKVRLDRWSEEVQKGQLVGWVGDNTVAPVKLLKRWIDLETGEITISPESPDPIIYGFYWIEVPEHIQPNMELNGLRIPIADRRSAAGRWFHARRKAAGVGMSK